MTGHDLVRLLAQTLSELTALVLAASWPALAVVVAVPLLIGLASRTLLGLLAPASWTFAAVTFVAVAMPTSDLSILALPAYLMALAVALVELRRTVRFRLLREMQEQVDDLADDVESVLDTLKAPHPPHADASLNGMAPNGSSVAKIAGSRVSPSPASFERSAE